MLIHSFIHPFTHSLMTIYTHLTSHAILTSLPSKHYSHTYSLSSNLCVVFVGTIAIVVALHCCLYHWYKNRHCHLYHLLCSYHHYHQIWKWYHSWWTLVWREARGSALFMRTKGVRKQEDLLINRIQDVSTWCVDSMTLQTYSNQHAHSYP